MNGNDRDTLSLAQAARLVSLLPARVRASVKRNALNATEALSLVAAARLADVSVSTLRKHLKSERALGALSDA